MNLKNAETYIMIKEALTLVPTEPKRQIEELIKTSESESDEILEHTLEAIRLTLGEDFGIIT